MNRNISNTASFCESALNWERGKEGLLHTGFAAKFRDRQLTMPPVEHWGMYPLSILVL